MVIVCFCIGHEIVRCGVISFCLQIEVVGVVLGMIRGGDFAGASLRVIFSFRCYQCLIMRLIIDVLDDIHVES